MKRSAFLRPLSREHHAALSLARDCERAARSGEAAKIEHACQRALRDFLLEHDRHFATEERTLLPLLQEAETQPLVQRTLDDHRRLRGLLDGLRQCDAEALRSFGKCLADHVRFEERELFPALERLPGFPA